MSSAYIGLIWVTMLISTVVTSIWVTTLISTVHSTIRDVTLVNLQQLTRLPPGLIT